MTDINQAIYNKPDWVILLVDKARIERDRGHLDEAFLCLEEGMRLEPELAWLGGDKGITLRLMERYDDALAEFDRAIELDPDHAWVVAQRGITYRRMELYDEALADFERAIELDPKAAWICTQKGITLREMERYDDALTEFDRAIELDSSEDWNFYNRALTYKVLKQTGEAEADFTAAIQRAQKVCERTPQKWSSVFDLALYQMAIGEAEEAERLYRQALSGRALPYHIRTAIRDLDNFLALFPNHSDAQALRDLLEQHLRETLG